MDGLGVRRDLRIDERTSHHGGNAIDQRVLDDAVRDVHHPMRAEFEHAELGCAQPATNGQARAHTESRHRARHHRHILQSMRAGQRFQG